MGLREQSRSFSPEVVRRRVLECITALFRETPVLEERWILEKVSKLLNVDSEKVYEVLRECVAKGILKVFDEGIRCEFCCEDVSLKDLRYDARSVEELIGESVYCIFCDNENIVTEDHIYRYYKLKS